MSKNVFFNNADSKTINYLRNNIIFVLKKLCLSLFRAALCKIIFTLLLH
jgi:hypothetical protein